MLRSLVTGKRYLYSLVMLLAAGTLWVAMFLGGLLFIEVEYATPAGASPSLAAPPASAMAPLAAIELRREGALVVDVRTPEEFASGHLAGAINIPHDQVQKRIAEFGEEKSRPILVYCRSGRRSSVAQLMLAEAGFTGVRNGGGYEALAGALRTLGEK